MHLYLFVRGKFEQVELWKSHVQAAYWKWRRINQNTNKEEITLVQGALRPTVFGAYEYIFPKEALAEVLACLGADDHNGEWHFGKLGTEARHFSLRKIFGCKKIPKKILKEMKNIPDSYATDEWERAVTNSKIPGVCVHLIGIKEDNMITLGDYLQEAL